MLTVSYLPWDALPLYQKYKNYFDSVAYCLLILFTALIYSMFGRVTDGGVYALGKNTPLWVVLGKWWSRKISKLSCYSIFFKKKDCFSVSNNKPGSF